MVKHTNEEVAANVEQVEAMLLDGKSSAEVVEHVISVWGLSEATAKNYMGRARARTAARLKDSGKLDALLGWCIHAYRFVYQRALESNQLGVAKGTLDSLVDILGLKRPAKIEVKHEGNGSTSYRDMADAQLAALIAAAQIAGQLPESTAPVEPQEHEQPSPH